MNCRRGLLHFLIYTITCWLRYDFMERLGKLDVIFQLTCHRTTLGSVPRNVRYKNTNRRTIDIPQHILHFKANCCLNVHNAHFKWHRQFLDKMTITLLKVIFWVFKEWYEAQKRSMVSYTGAPQVICMANFPKKSHEMKKNWLGKGWSPLYPLGSANAYKFQFSPWLFGSTSIGQKGSPDAGLRKYQSS